MVLLKLKFGLSMLAFFQACSGQNVGSANEKITVLRFTVPFDFQLTSQNIDDIFVYLPNFTEKNQGILKEITICGSFKLDFLLPQTLFTIGTNIVLSLSDLEQGILFYAVNGKYYMIHIKHDRILPKQWQHLCIALNDRSRKLDVVFNGVLLPGISDMVRSVLGSWSHCYR